MSTLKTFNLQHPSSAVINATLESNGAITAANIFNGNSGVTIAANGNVTLSSNGSVRMTLDTSGRLITPNRPAFFAYFSNNQLQFGTAGTTLWDATRYNVGNHYSSATGRFTAPVAGIYHFTLQTQHYASVSGTGVHDIQYNGYDINCRWEHAEGATWSAGGISVTLNMAVNDYVQCYSNANVWWSDNSFFSGHLVG